MVIVVAYAKCWPMFQLDVKAAFLHGPLEEEVYVQQLPGFINEGGEGENLLIICLYVDDLLITRSNPERLEELKRVMQSDFEMTDLGKLSYFLGMDFTYTAAGLILHQKKYAKELLGRFGMTVCNSARSLIEVNLKLAKNKTEEDAEETVFKQIVGSLRFLCNSILDLSFDVGLISRFMNNPKKSHMLTAKRLLRYVKGTVDFGILFPIGRHKTDGESLELIGFMDSDHGGDCLERKSTLGYIFMLNGSLISCVQRSSK
ncbi:uncharacterized mitochondrial protein AtMg00810-like [Vigna angularis]|uniref:uncharacterized mitochondrial protein AtMg00810-like n=1 Tax=Phaseolus angularis TaxID=3914 RepID=UPI00080A562A|nr:uncharacterized mitochondrial protein AtMg00810-like [Vigna angularis]